MNIQQAQAMRPDVPYPILAALVDPYYQEGLDEHFYDLPAKYREKNLSVTSLARSPRQRQLTIRHTHEIEQDPLESGYWKMFGSVVHAILERYKKPGDFVEQRMGMLIDGYWVHGQMDRLYYSIFDGHWTLQDWKLTKSESLLYGTKDEFVAQLNVLRYIALNSEQSPLSLPASNSYTNPPPDIAKLQNVYLSRNWDKRKSLHSEKYPSSPVVVIDIPIWPDDRILKYIKERIKVHHESIGVQDDELPECSDKERWMSDPVHKVFKFDPKTGERQVKSKYNADTMLEAIDARDSLQSEDFAKWIEKNQKLKKPKPDSEYPAPKFDIVSVKAQPTRCAYCEIASFCNQRMAEISDGAQSTEENEDEELPS